MAQRKTIELPICCEIENLIYLKKEANVLIDAEKKATDGSKMKLVSCFRGLDCLSLRHLNDEKPQILPK